MRYKDWTHAFREELTCMPLSQLVELVAHTHATDDCGDSLRCSWAKEEIDRRFPVEQAVANPAVVIDGEILSVLHETLRRLRARNDMRALKFTNWLADLQK